MQLRPLLTLAAIALILTMSSCATSQVAGVVDEAGDELADAADLAHETARRAYCDGTTMGAARRAYSGKPEALRAYLEACGWETWPEKP